MAAVALLRRIWLVVLKGIFSNKQQSDFQEQAGNLGNRGLILLGEVVCAAFTDNYPMKVRTVFPFVTVLSFVFTIAPRILAQADTFGTGTNSFTLDFVSVGNAGNLADTTGYGAVPYEYRIGKYEISRNDVIRATAGGLANVTAGPWTGNQPAATINWYEAAAFVNWLNTSTGYQAAYDLTWNGSAWSMSLWSGGDAWTLGGTNLYRHKDAYYFLPSENEWYKAAYYNPSGSSYYDYPTGSDTAPTPVASGTNAGTAVYTNASAAPAVVDLAGGLSPYGTMAQGGNVWEWSETAFDGSNSSSTEVRAFRGGSWQLAEDDMRALDRLDNAPTDEGMGIGFRVASVPEPSTYALLAMSAAGALSWARRRR
jgi:sulfatase modifying factor 1